MKKIFIAAAAFAVSALQAANSAWIEFATDRESCVYRPGETAQVTITVTDTNGVKLTKGRYHLKVDNFGAKEISRHEIDLSKENPFKLPVTRATPGFIRLNASRKDGDFKFVSKEKRHESSYGIAFGPEQIEPGTPNPADFDKFWADAIAGLEKSVPIDVKMELVPEKSKGAYNFYRVSFATYGGRRVYGWVTKPKDLSKGPFPVRLSVPGAGIGATSVGGGANIICMMMNVHSYPQPEGKGKEAEAARKAKYKEQDEKYAKPVGVPRYCHAGIHKSREDYFYYASLLGINRAVNWLVAQPECDKNDVSYSGTSQGGGFGLMLTGLNSNIKFSRIYVPAITDLLSNKIEGRQSGWPRIIENQRPENMEAAEKWAPYFCGVNFARRIKVPVRFVVGFADSVCAPHAVYAAYNVCPSKDKKMYHGVGMGHGVFPKFYRDLK